MTRMPTPPAPGSSVTKKAAYFAGSTAILAGLVLLLTVPSDAIAALLVVLAGCLTVFGASFHGAYLERRNSYADRDRTGGPQR
jgi:uncharacterized membrane protein